MARQVVITGRGIISPLGDSPQSVHEALCAGRVALKPIELFEATGIENAVAGEIRNFEPSDYLEPRNLRPLDRTSRLLTVAAQLALTDSGRTPEQVQDAEIGFAVGTMFCGAHTIADFDTRALKEGPHRSSPLDFANTVINAAAGQAALWHKLRGPNSTISTGTTSGLQALAYGYDLIRNGRVRAMLAGGVEELCYETYFGFFNSGALCNSRNERPLPIPFDARRNGFFVAEGAALLMLEDAESATRRGANILGEIKGYGAAFDSQSRSRPRHDSEQAANSIANSIRIALEDAGVNATQIDAVSAAANGSVAADRAESVALGAHFSERSGSLPVTAIKSMFGEGLGSSGAIQAVAMLESMQDGKLPGISGLEQIEDGLSIQSLTARTQEAQIQHAIINSIGLDGNSCSLVIGAFS